MLIYINIIIYNIDIISLFKIFNYICAEIYNMFQKYDYYKNI